MVPRRRPRRAGCEPHLPPEHRSRSAGACANPRSLPPPRSGRGAALCGVCCRRHETKHAPPNCLSAKRGRHPMPCSRSGASACLATEMCRKRSAASAKPAQRSGRASSGRRVRPTTLTSPAMVRAAHARGSGLALQHTLPSATAGRADCSAEDCASRGRSSKSRRQTRYLQRARSASCPGELRSSEFSLRRQRA